MVVDLEGAIALNALPMREESKNYGRVTLAMAYMLYAEIVMYQNDDSRYTTALKYMTDIINSGKYDLVDNYAGKQLVITLIMCLLLEELYCPR